MDSTGVMQPATPIGSESPSQQVVHGVGGHPYRKPGPSAEQLAAEAMAADMDMWITYVPSVSKNSREPFETWLQRHLPANESRSDGIGWICVRAPDYTGEEDSIQDLCGLQESWELYLASGRKVTPDGIKELAKAYNVLSGKWMLHTSTGMKVNHLWSLIARAVVEGKCGTSAKVSPFEPTTDGKVGKHVVCIYNNDYTNYDEVLALENSIRAAGIKCPLTYKPDVYTDIGVYRNNEWDIPPTIYKSVYDISKGHSTVSKSRNYYAPVSDIVEHIEAQPDHADEPMEVTLEHVEQQL